MKIKIISFFLIVLSLIMVTISVTTLNLEAGEGVGDWGYVCCGLLCPVDICRDPGTYPCCYG